MSLSAIFRFFDKRERLIGNVPLDAVVIEDYSHENVITDHPTEQGYSINDHAFSLPFRLNLSCIISRSSITPFGGLKGISQRHIEAYQQLKKLYDDKTPLNIITQFQRFPNMIIESFRPVNSVQNGEGLYFQCTLKQILVTQTFTVPFNEETVKGDFVAVASSERDLGRQAVGDFNG